MIGLEVKKLLQVKGKEDRIGREVFWNPVAQRPGNIRELVLAGQSSHSGGRGLHLLNEVSETVLGPCEVADPNAV